MRAGDTNSLGETIRNLRMARGMTRAELAETVGISESHLNKIEAGTRQPGITTYQKVIDALGAEVVIKDDNETLQGKCAAKARDIMWNSTEKKAVYLTKMLITMAENLDSVM